MPKLVNYIANFQFHYIKLLNTKIKQIKIIKIKVIKSIFIYCGLG